MGIGGDILGAIAQGVLPGAVGGVVGNLARLLPLSRGGSVRRIPIVLPSGGIRMRRGGHVRRRRMRRGGAARRRRR